MSTKYPTLKDVAEDYVRLRRARFAKVTVDQEEIVLRRFIAFVGDIQVRHLRADHVEAFFYGPGGVMDEHRTRDGMVRKPVSASTHNYLRTRLKVFFGYCAQRGLTRAPLLAQVTPMRVEVKERLQPSVEALWAMLDSADSPRDRALMAVAMNTGLRAASIVDLRVGDVDLDNLTLHVRVSKSKIQDALPVTADLSVELARWLTVYRTDCAAADQPLQVTADSYLFPSFSGPRFRWRSEEDGRRVRYQVPGGWTPSIPTRKIHRVVQRALQKIGLESTHEGIHTVRRAVARHYFDGLVEERGYDGAIRVVSSLLHHSNTSTTERYLGLARERQVRDETLRGRSLLGPRPMPAGVVPIRATR